MALKGMLVWRKVPLIGKAVYCSTSSVRDSELIQEPNFSTKKKKTETEVNGLGAEDLFSAPVIN